MIAGDRSFHGGHVSCLIAHCTLHLHKVHIGAVHSFKINIFHGGHVSLHIAHVIVDKAESKSYCIVDISNITLHISRSTYSTVDVFHCTLYIALAQSTDWCCAQLQDRHIPRWTCLIAHCTCHGGQSRKYINSSYCTVNITLQNVSLHMPRWKAHIASWTY